jgi:hypothetical protein
LTAPTQHRPWSDSGQSGFLGAAHIPFRPDGPGMADLTLNGISTDRLHARGPIGLEQLTTYKYVVWGDGQIRT